MVLLTEDHYTEPNSKVKRLPEPEVEIAVHEWDHDFAIRAGASGPIDRAAHPCLWRKYPMLLN